MSNPVLDTIAARRSHRAYAQTPVTQEQTDALLKAAVEAPSAVNRQPWHFTFVRNQSLLDDINQAVRARMMLTEPEKRSPRFDDPSFNVFYGAPLVIFLSSDPAWRFAAMDCGIAVQNIALAAESLGLGSVILGMPREAFLGDKAEDFRRALRFPEGHDFQIAIAVGVPADDKPAHPILEDRVDFVD